MILNKECDYAFRIIRILQDGKKKTVDVICNEEMIPKSFAYKLLKRLESTGFLQSFRGRDGGYKLIRNTDSFTMYDVVTLFNKEFIFNECLTKGSVCKRMEEESKSYCKFHIALQDLQMTMENELKKRSIAEILKHSEEYTI